VVGRRTVIMNFKEIADEMRRDPDHLLKFLSGEMATLANFDGTRAIFQGAFRADSIRNLLEVYTERYVVCPVCKRPDTRIVRERRLWFLDCEACGARSSIGAK
jgi:translation initiation factor 2 subunit 2